jgi:hypothetical protein
MNGGFRVIWRRRVSERQLASIVVKAMERGESVNAITAAVSEIDRLLATAPQAHGESRDHDKRVLIVPPLSVLYEILLEEAVVIVLGLHYRPQSMDDD